MLNFKRRLFVWNAYKCYRVEHIKTHVVQHTNTNLSIGQLTKLVQPADGSWNKAFETMYKDKHSKWMVSGQKGFTAAGNMPAPSKAHCLKWVKKCWSSLGTELNPVCEHG